MSDITKKVDRGIFPTQRSQIFTNSDAGAGDVILVKDSLGHSARSLTVDATDAMSIRLNVYRTVFVQRRTDQNLSPWAPGLPNVASGIQVKDETNARIDLDPSETFTLTNEMPIDDIELVAVSGVYEILVI